MKIETKELGTGAWVNKDAQVALMAKFGWEHTQDVSHGRGGSGAIYARDTEMPNYRLIAALEDKYFMLEKKKKHYSPITDSPENFLLILLLVVPFVLYLIFKIRQKKRIAKHNASIEAQQNEILKEVATLL